MYIKVSLWFRMLLLMLELWPWGTRCGGCVHDGEEQLGDKLMQWYIWLQEGEGKRVFEVISVSAIHACSCWCVCIFTSIINILGVQTRIASEVNISFF